MAGPGMVVSALEGRRGYRRALLVVFSTIVVRAGRSAALAEKTLLSLLFFRYNLGRRARAGVVLSFLLLLPTHLLLAADAKEPKRVLILYSFDREQGIHAGIDESLRSRLRARLPNPVEFYTEYLDLVRFPDPGHAQTMVKLLRLRLAEKKPDLIVAGGYAASDFALKNRKELFPQTPIVMEFSEPSTGDLQLGPEERSFITGMKFKEEPSRTLDLALQLQPDTQRVVVVVGSSPSEKFWLEQHRIDLARFEGKVTLTYLTDLPMDAILKQVTHLPPHTIVFFSHFLQDAGGQFFNSVEALDLIANASNSPIYGSLTSHIGHGAVGGYMEDARETGTATADLAVRVLTGEKPADIPMVVGSFQDTVDLRQLKRWGISERRVPPGSIVLFKEPSIWDRYWPYVIGVFGLFIFEAFLILGLLVQRQERKRAEKRLRSEKAFSDAVIESLPGIFFMQDEKLKNVRWNRNAEIQAKYHPSQAQQLGNVSEKSQITAREKIREVFERGAAQAEIEMLGQGGSAHHYQVNAHRVELEGKRYVVAVGIDISERKQAEEELRLSEARFSSAFEYAPIGIALVAPNGSFIKVNGTLCELLGYAPEELQTKTFKDVTHPDDVETSLKSARQALASEARSYQMQKRYIHKSGRVVWAWLSTFLVRDAKGQPLYFISQIQDITERKRAEDDLRYAEERFAKAFQSSPEMCAITTLREPHFIEANDAFLRILGYERSEVIGKTVAELRIWPDPEERAAVVKKVFEGPAAREEDVRFRTKSGRILQVRMSAEIIHLQNEPCLLGLARDVTEQNLLEEQFRQAQKMEAVGRLAGGIAHDFNNLLGVIIGYSELVSSGLPADSVLHKRVEAIKQAGQRAAALTTQLLAFSRKQTLQPRVVNLNSVVTETEKLLRPLLGEDIERMVALDAKLGQVKADAGQIVQVIMNLAVNARDAMPNGGKLSIETANVAVHEGTMYEGLPAQPGFYVMLSVGDTGTGMDEETKARIFEPFYTTKPAGKGTGLGLATVYSIVDQNGGCIFVDTRIGRGTTFKIYLPRIDEVVEAPAVQAAPAKATQVSGTVLLVEDELGLRTVVDESLRQEGYRVLLAANGMDALEVAARHQGPIQLLITDVIMPFVSGPQLAQSLKALRPETRVLYISGYTADKFADYPSLDPELALLQKPFKLVDLSQKVRDLLNERAEAYPRSVQ
jgi:two-component system, cell cycle sensor histidine kinase and response regulator CckA